VRRTTALVAGGVTLALVVVASWLARQPGSPVAAQPGGAIPRGTAWGFLAVLLAAFGCYLAGLALLRRGVPSLVVVTAIAVAIQGVPLAAPLLLSSDAWTYWSYGWIASEGDANPYSDPPDTVPGNPALPYMGAAWVDTTTVYGPLFTAASEPVAVVARASADTAASTFKVLSALAAVAAAVLAGRVSRRRALAVAFVGWNPLLAVHMGGGGHNDAWIGALVAAALALAAGRRLHGAGALWALAIFVKWVPIVFLALRAFEARATGRRTSHLGFAIATLAVTGLATLLYGVAWVSAAAQLADNAALETSYAIPARLQQAGIPHGAALALAAAALVAGLVALAGHARRGRARLGLAACLLLLTTPYLAVWYLGWAVPVVAADEDRLARGVCLALCLYLLPQTVPL
jgi:Glycosyltransferase family 87